MKLITRNWWKFWSEESGIVGAFIYGAVVAGAIIGAVLLTTP